MKRIKNFLLGILSIVTHLLTFAAAFVAFMMLVQGVGWAIQTVGLPAPEFRNPEGGNALPYVNGVYVMTTIIYAAGLFVSGILSGIAYLVFRVIAKMGEDFEEKWL